MGLDMEWNECMGRGGGQKPSSVLGYSAGALAAVFLPFPEISQTQIIQVASQLVNDCHIGHLDKIIRRMLTLLLPSDAHIRAQSSSIQILLCSPWKSFRGQIESKWESTQQLIDCVVASCFIPGIVSFGLYDPVYHCIDGIFSLDMFHLSQAYDTIPIPYFGFWAQFHVITEKEALDLGLAGKEACALHKFSNDVFCP